MKKVYLVMICLILINAFVPIIMAQTDHQIKFEIIKEDEKISKKQCHEYETQNFIIKTEKEYKNLWHDFATDKSPRPKIDFDNYLIIFMVTTATDLNTVCSFIPKIVEENGTIKIDAGVVYAALEQIRIGKKRHCSYIFIKLKKTDQQIVFL